MKQYLELLKTILNTGDVKESGRAGMPNTKGIFAYQMRFNLADGFPLLTTKKMPFKLIAHELIWFLRGDTNIKYLVDNGCNIWNGDAYRHYRNKCKEVGETFYDSVTQDEFIAQIKKDNAIDGCRDGQAGNPLVPMSNKLRVSGYKLGDLGEVYGAQWRNWDNKGIDQIKKVIDGIKKNPYGRRHIVSAWNPAEVDNMALPPCHLLFQFNCRPISLRGRNELAADIPFPPGRPSEVGHAAFDDFGVPKFYLDCVLTQRSCDTILGVPFNIASYALLTEVVAKMCGMVAGEFIWNGNDVHIYDNHFAAAVEQMIRDPKPLCTLKVSDRVKEFKDISELTIADLELEKYEHHPPIKAELSVGV